MTTVYNSSHAWEVHLARHRLEQAGIPTLITDENTVRMQWFYANAVGGIKLQVPGKDAEAARAILLEMQTTPQKTDDLPDCPGCISLVNRRSKWNLLLGIVTFLLVGIPLLFIPRKTCSECGKTHRVL